MAAGIHVHDVSRLMSYIPHSGEFVWCNYPYDTNMGGIRPGPKARPCLVLETSEKMGSIYVTVAYGTSKSRSGKYILTLDPSQKEAFHASGLFMPTKFDLLHKAKLPWSEDFFPSVPAMYGRPSRENCYLGVMHPRVQSSIKEIFNNMRIDPDARRIMMSENHEQPRRTNIPRN